MDEEFRFIVKSIILFQNMKEHEILIKKMDMEKLFSLMGVDIMEIDPMISLKDLENLLELMELVLKDYGNKEELKEMAILNTKMVKDLLVSFVIFII